ncbi:hypothetical protein BT69DRAFT_546724 [Atractiella rhizophila]|nr:hypothetical protein BT69DRAFT_546724 [Atractiella rhizophila]
MILPESPTASDSKPYPPPPSLSLPPAAPSYHSHPHAHHSSTYPPASPSHYQHQHRSPSPNPFHQNEQEDEQIANAVFSPSYEAEVERAAEQEAIDSPPILLSAPDPPPGWSPPSLRRPIIIPEVTGQFGAPFSRCFPQILDLFQVNKAEFIDMIDRLNKVWAPSGVWNNLDVAANVIGLVPEVTFMVASPSKWWHKRPCEYRKRKRQTPS